MSFCHPTNDNLVGRSIWSCREKSCKVVNTLHCWCYKHRRQLLKEENEISVLLEGRLWKSHQQKENVKSGKPMSGHYNPAKTKRAVWFSRKCRIESIFTTWLWKIYGSKTKEMVGFNPSQKCSLFHFSKKIEAWLLSFGFNGKLTPCWLINSWKKSLSSNKYNPSPLLQTEKHNWTIRMRSQNRKTYMGRLWNQLLWNPLACDTTIPPNYLYQKRLVCLSSRTHWSTHHWCESVLLYRQRSISNVIFHRNRIGIWHVDSLRCRQNWCKQTGWTTGRIPKHLLLPCCWREKNVLIVRTFQLHEST